MTSHSNTILQISPSHIEKLTQTCTFSLQNKVVLITRIQRPYDTYIFAFLQFEIKLQFCF